MSRAKNDRKRRRHKRERISRPPAPPFPASDFAWLSYTITEEPILHTEPGNRVLERVLAGRHDALFAQVHNDPSAAVPQLLELIEQYPQAPMLYNWLAVAYGLLGKFDEAGDISRLNYERNPHYLFARCNFAQVCMMRGDLEQVRSILDGKFDLKLMYPERDVFHRTEFLTFCDVVVEYLARTGERRAAKLMFATLVDLAPRDVVTRRLRRVLFGPSLMDVARGLVRLFLGRRRRRSA